MIHVHVIRKKLYVSLFAGLLTIRLPRTREHVFNQLAVYGYRFQDIGIRVTCNQLGLPNVLAISHV